MHLKKTTINSSHTSWQNGRYCYSTNKIKEVHMTLAPPANEKDRKANLNRKECKTARQIWKQTPREFKG